MFVKSSNYERGCVRMATFVIRGKDIEITPALRGYVEKRVSKIEKYFDNIGEISVRLSAIKGTHKVEVTVPIEGGGVLRGEDVSGDMYSSIDMVVNKLERKIHKHKTRLARRFRSGGFKAEIVAEEIRHRPIVEATDDDYAPVKVKKFPVKPMDVDEAIMQMNLVNHDFYVFRNMQTEEINVVYRRNDNRYGLIEPQR